MKIPTPRAWAVARAACAPLAVAISLVLIASPVAAADPVGLEYLARYERQGESDHLMGVETLLGHYALVSSNRALTLIDLDVLTADGTTEFVSRIPLPDAYNTVTDPTGRFVYVNIQRGGIEVVSVNPIDLSLTRVGSVEEPGVFFEKMFLLGNRLYVAAHGSGIRIYDVSDPTSPMEVGSLTTGFEDAFAIAVAGQTAYVADGAGGLKIVDLSSESNPVIVAGEDPSTAAATAEDVLIIGDKVYLACGGAGVATYPRGEIARSALHDTRVAAKELEKIGPYLAVADLGGIELFAPDSAGVLTRLTGEAGSRRSIDGGTLPTDVTFRTWHGVAAWNDSLVAANWDTVDVYQLAMAPGDWQPDVTASSQRLHFPPGGGELSVVIRNDGPAVLEIFDVRSEPTFSVSPTSGTLEPGGSLELTIEYVGGEPGAGLVLIDSNDPDETPLPIQVFGDTSFLDPGEPALPFALESWTYDHAAEEFAYDLFDLEAYRGRFVFLHIFGTW